MNALDSAAFISGALWASAQAGSRSRSAAGAGEKRPAAENARAKRKREAVMGNGEVSPAVCARSANPLRTGQLLDLRDVEGLEHTKAEQLRRLIDPAVLI